MPDSNAVKAPIEIRFTYSREDIKKAARLDLIKGSVFYLMIFFCGLLVVLGLIGLMSDTPVGVLLMLMGLLFLAIIFRSAAKNAMKQYKRMPQLYDEVIYRFHDDFFEFFDSVSNMRSKWLYKTEASSEVLLLYTNNVSYKSIPRRVCASDEEFETIAAWTASLVDKQ